MSSIVAPAHVCLFDRGWPRNHGFSPVCINSACITNSRARAYYCKQSTAARTAHGQAHHGRHEIPRSHADKLVRPVFSRRLSPSSAAADRRPAFRHPEGKRVQPRDLKPLLVAPLSALRPQRQGQIINGAAATATRDYARAPGPAKLAALAGFRLILSVVIKSGNPVRHHTPVSWQDF